METTVQNFSFMFDKHLNNSYHFYLFIVNNISMINFIYFKSSLIFTIWPRKLLQNKVQVQIVISMQVASYAVKMHAGIASLYYAYISTIVTLLENITHMFYFNMIN